VMRAGSFIGMGKHQRAVPSVGAVICGKEVPESH